MLPELLNWGGGERGKENLVSVKFSWLSDFCVVKTGIFDETPGDTFDFSAFTGMLLGFAEICGFCCSGDRNCSWSSCDSLRFSRSVLVTMVPLGDSYVAVRNLIWLFLGKSKSECRFFGSFDWFVFARFCSSASCLADTCLSLWMKSFSSSMSNS